MKYSVFISYRRTGFETANLIAEKLRSMGYSVFFDVETMRGGKFNEQLFSVIDKCKDFVLVLPENALDRCADKDDWVRKEVTYAMLKGKNIVPVMLSGFTWPDPMPGGMEELQFYQAVTANDRETFDYSMQRLASFLQSSRRNKRLIVKVLAIIVAAAAILTMLFFMLRVLGRSQCEHVASYWTGCTECIHEEYDDVKDLHKEWNAYVSRRNRAVNAERRAELDQDLCVTLDEYRNRNQQLREIVPPVPELGVQDAFLLGVYGVLTLEVEMNDIMVRSYFDDLDSLVSTINLAVTQMDGAFAEDAKMNVDLSFDLYDNMVGMYYASYLGDISRLPKSSLRLHDSLRKSWNLFPVIPENLSLSQYEDLIMDYTHRSEACLDGIRQIVNKQAHQVDAMQDYLDSLSTWVDEAEQKLKNIE